MDPKLLQFSASIYNREGIRIVSKLSMEELSMSKYLVIYHAGKSAVKKISHSNSEEAKKGMEAWMTWAQKCGKGLLDMGAPLGYGQKVGKTGSTPSKRNVVGFSVLQAENMAKAKAMLKNHPHLKWAADCEIEVHEFLPLPGSK